MPSPLLDPTAAAILKSGLEKTEEDLRSGRLTEDVAVDSLAEVDGYYMSARQADGSRVTGLLLRVRQNPSVYFMIPGIVVVGRETSRILDERLPPPPPPTPKPAVPAAPPRQSQQAQKSKKAAEVAIAAAKKRVGKKAATGSLDIPDLPEFSPGTDPDGKIPQG